MTLEVVQPFHVRYYHYTIIQPFHVGYYHYTIIQPFHVRYYHYTIIQPFHVRYCHYTHNRSMSGTTITHKPFRVRYIFVKVCWQPVCQGLLATRKFDAPMLLLFAPFVLFNCLFCCVDLI